MHFGLRGSRYGSLELVVQLGLHPGLAETREVRQLGTRVSNQRALEENTQTNSCILFDEGSLIHSASSNITLRGTTCDCSMITRDQQMRQKFVKKHTLTDPYISVIFDGICNVNKSCGILGLGGERGGTHWGNWKYDGHC